MDIHCRCRSKGGHNFGFDLITHFCEDFILKYLYHGPIPGKS